LLQNRQAAFGEKEGPIRYGRPDELRVHKELLAVGCAVAIRRGR
jgi:hypothetical protein